MSPNGKTHNKHTDALWRCKELEEDILQMVQDLGMCYEELGLVLSRMLYKIQQEYLKQINEEGKN